MKRLTLSLALAALVGCTVSPAHAGFDEWLRGVMDAPGLHAGKHYRDARPAKAAKVVDPMRLIRNKMVSGAKVTTGQLQQLADSGDDLAAYNLGKRLEEEADPAQLPVAIGYYSRAVEGGRDFAIRPIVRLLEADVGADDPDLMAHSETLLTSKAIGDAFVRDALIRMYRAGKPFGLHPDKAEAMLSAAAEAGDSKAALDIAFVLLTGTPDATSIEIARAYLKIAATSDTLNVRTMAENLLRSLDTQRTASTETAQ